MNYRHLMRGLFVAVLAFGATACAPDAPDGAGSAEQVRDASVAAASAAGVLQPGDTVEFFASEFAFAPYEITAEPGTYRGILVNQGEVDHDIKFDNGDSIVASAGQSVEFGFTVPEGGCCIHLHDFGTRRCRHGRHRPHPCIARGGSSGRRSRSCLTSR